jgi:dTMP kinase
MKRILVSRPKLRFYEAGMDLNLSNDVLESYRMFQARIIEQYELMAEQEGFTIIDGSLDIEEQQEKVREAVSQLLPATTKQMVQPVIRA